MTKEGKATELNFFGVIHNHLFGLIKLSTWRQDTTPHVDALLSYLKPYVDDELDKFRCEAPGDEHGNRIHKIKIAMLALHRIGVIPHPSAGNKKRVYSSYDKKEEEGFGISHGGISNRRMFRQLLMKYYSLLSELTFAAFDMEAIKYTLDTGYALLTPYVTEDDRKSWKMCNFLAKLDPYSAMKKRMEILSMIMDREGFLFQRRFIDEMTIDSYEDYEELLEEDERELYS